MRKNKWKKFEKLAAAIRVAEQRGAAVKWDSRIADQRFNAILRSVYENQEYVIVVETIGDITPVTAARVKSFARKVDAAGAHIGILVSAADYLQDAFELTAEHSVALLNLETVNEESEQKLADIFKLALHFYSFRFLVAGRSEEIAIPEEPAVLRSLMRQIQIKGPSIDTFPEQLLKDARDEVTRSAIARPQRYEMALPQGTMLIHPNTKAETPIRAFAFTYRLIPEAELLSPEAHHNQDPYGVEASLKEELLKRNPSADPTKIDAGFDTILRPKRYYYNPQLQFSYYCEEVKKGQAKIVLVESYQNDGLLQARGIISRPLYNQFVEITEKSEIERLSKLYDTFSVSYKNLEGRFKVFLRDLEGAECIDDLPLTPEQQKANKDEPSKADYFFDNRKVIGELKALYTDATTKVEAILAPYRKTPEWPIFFGEQDLQKILRQLPDGARLGARIIDAITDSIEGVVEKANRQIRTTKETFGLPDAGGLLIILNDAVDILSPDLVTRRVRKALNKRTADGGPRFPHVSAVLLIGGAHYTQMTPSLKAMPILLLPNTVPEAERVDEFVSVLNKKWSAFEGRPLIDLDPETASRLDFHRLSDDAKRAAAGPLTRQDYLSAMYERNPYLRQLSEEQVLDFGSRALEDMAMRLIKGAPPAPKEEMEEIMIRWSNFLDEAKYRAIDMRKLAARSEGFNERMEELYQKYQEQAQS
jgi:hypothetical protein